MNRNFIRMISAILNIPLIFISYIVPRNKNLWLFGNFKGYFDNPKYIYEKLNKSGKNVKCIWITKSKLEYKKLKQKNIDVEYYLSLRGLYLSYRAGIVFLTNGFSDLNRIASMGAYVVQLWHGMPIKKIQLDSEIDTKISLPLLGPILTIFHKLLMRTVNQNIDLFIVNNEKEQHRISRAFGISKNKVVILGSPRLEIIQDKNLSKNICKKLQNINKNCKVKILYAPSWRENGWDENHFIHNYKKIDKALKKLNACIYIKTHPLTSLEEVELWNIKKIENIYLLNESAFNDINQIYNCVDILITDFSSLIYDFSSLSKPIIFFIPDLETYEANRGFYENPVLIAENKINKTWDQLINEIENVIKNGKCNSIEKFNKVDNSKNINRIIEYLESRI
ncbi:CDP-glycerol glycerophosphotransferase family protein [Hydrogenimonas sp. SS33]|uniref:CDP-glycerol glycerophosphotransferase family protein n=1 Tax=Hydrogenimonas leucolamina TaxID=2954236 RepID=UPI00336BCEB8